MVFTLGGVCPLNGAFLRSVNYYLHTLGGLIMSNTIKIKEVKAFIELLGKAVAAASSKIDSIMSGVMVVAEGDEINIRGTDSSISVEASGKEITETAEQVSFVVPAKIFLDMMKKLPKGDVELAMEENRLDIKVGKSTYGISTMDCDQYPKPLQVEEGTTFKVEGTMFAESLACVAHATADNETRPILTGVHVLSNGKYLTLIATDSHRLSAKAVPLLAETEEFANVVLPKSAVKEITSILSDTDEVEFSITQNQLACRTEGLVFATRLIEGTYPDVTRLIPNEFENEVVVHRDEFLKALDRTKVALGKDKVATFRVVSGTLPTLNIECKTEITNIFEELFVDEAGSNDLSIKLNVHYLIDGLNSMNSKKIRLQFSGALKPMLLKPEIEGSTQFGLLLPVR